MPSAMQCGKDCVCQCSHPLHTAFPNLFGPQDLSSSGMLHAMENVFRSYTNRSFNRPNVTTVTSKCHHGDKQTLACFLYHSRCTACSDCLSSQESKHRERAAVFSSVEDQLATLAFLKPRVAELIEELIGVNNKGFNPDLEENTAQLDADFYP